MSSSDRRRQRRLEALSDRIEDRLVDAPEGLHQVGGPGDRAALEAAGLPEEAVELWRRWDGMVLGTEEARLLPFAEQQEATAELGEILAEGDRVIGEIGRGVLVLPADPWEEGAEVVLVEEDGERAPYASSVLRLALGLLAEMAALYDDEGEYREGLFDEHSGELEPKAERRLLRRRLDFDEDAPLPRFRLGQLLRRAGELGAARAELRRVLKCAPQFSWAQWELGRVELELERRGDDEAKPGQAARSFAAAAELAQDPHVRALFLAWQALASEGEAREGLAQQVLGLDPGFVGAREAGVREAVEDGDRERAEELLGLALAVGPRQLGVLGLRAVVEGMSSLDSDSDSSGSD